MQDAARQALCHAIDRNCPAVLRIAATQDVERANEATKVRFLGRDDRQVWVESPARQPQLAALLLRSAGPVSVTFRYGEHVAEFRSFIRTYCKDYPLSASAAVEALGLEWPAEICIVQRRGGYRAQVPMQAQTTLAVWQIDEGAPIAVSPTTQRMTGELRDLSIQGMGLVLRREKGQTLRVAVGDRLRIEWSDRQRQLVLAARVQQPPQRQPDGSLRLGLTFEGLADTIEGRKSRSQLEQLVAELQRVEARRRTG